MTNINGFCDQTLESLHNFRALMVCNGWNDLIMPQDKWGELYVVWQLLNRSSISQASLNATLKNMIGKIENPNNLFQR